MECSYNKVEGMLETLKEQCTCIFFHPNRSLLKLPYRGKIENAVKKSLNGIN